MQNLLAVALIAALGSTAQSEPQQEATTDQSADKEVKTSSKANDANKKICKKFPPKAGSRLRARKVCMTKGEWDLEKQDRDRQLDRVQGRNPYDNN